MKRYLIINADGYGFTPGVNAGIIETFKSGLVTSTSCTPNFGHLGDTGDTQKRFPQVSFGIHFNLSVGRPVSPPRKVRSLLGEDDKFIGDQLLPRILKKQVSEVEVGTELAAQAALLADQSVKISHWDGHLSKTAYQKGLDFKIGCSIIESILRLGWEPPR